MWSCNEILTLCYFLIFGVKCKNIRDIVLTKMYVAVTSKSAKQMYEIKKMIIL